MDHHPLANIFKRSNYDEAISSDLSALDYLYEFSLKFVNLKIVMKKFIWGLLLAYGAPWE